MEKKAARRIIRKLADGIDPESGLPLPDTSPFNNVQVVRALYLATESLGEKGRSTRENRHPGNSGKPWTEDSDRELLRAFDSGISTRDLAKQFERTNGAILSRLFKLGRDPGEK